MLRRANRYAALGIWIQFTRSAERDSTIDPRTRVSLRLKHHHPVVPPTWLVLCRISHRAHSGFAARVHRVLGSVEPLSVPVPRRSQ
jgi:hypothetical protein